MDYSNNYSFPNNYSYPNNQYSNYQHINNNIQHQNQNQTNSKNCQQCYQNVLKSSTDIICENCKKIIKMNRMISNFQYMSESLYMSLNSFVRFFVTIKLFNDEIRVFFAFMRKKFYKSDKEIMNDVWNNVWNKK